jgi:hypothetical protein
MLNGQCAQASPLNRASPGTGASASPVALRKAKDQLSASLANASCTI